MAARVEVMERLFAKLVRATKQIGELDALFTEFINCQKDVIMFHDDLSLGQRTYYMAEVRPVSLPIAAQIGDIIHNLRSALDHVVFHMRDIHKAPAIKMGSFPITETSTDYYSSKYRRRIEDLPQPAIDVIDSFKPYKGGNDTLWRLHSLDIQDKHRLLITAGTRYRLRSITTEELNRHLAEFRKSNPRLTEGDLVGTHVSPSVSRFPMKNGDELMSFPINDLNQDVSFTFDIAFNEADIVGELVTEVLARMTSEVAAIINALNRANVL